jgi:hypothetical protein
MNMAIQEALGWFCFWFCFVPDFWTQTLTLCPPPRFTVLMSTIIRRYDLNIVNEDDPKKWGLYDADPAKRRGR